MTPTLQKRVLYACEFLFCLVFAHHSCMDRFYGSDLNKGLHMRRVLKCTLILFMTAFSRLGVTLCG